MFTYEDPSEKVSSLSDESIVKMTLPSALMIASDGNELQKMFTMEQLRPWALSFELAATLHSAISTGRSAALLSTLGSFSKFIKNGEIIETGLREVGYTDEDHEAVKKALIGIHNQMMSGPYLIEVPHPNLFSEVTKRLHVLLMQSSDTHMDALTDALMNEMGEHQPIELAALLKSWEKKQLAPMVFAIGYLSSEPRISKRDDFCRAALRLGLEREPANIHLKAPMAILVRLMDEGPWQLEELVQTRMPEIEKMFRMLR